MLNRVFALVCRLATRQGLPLPSGAKSGLNHSSTVVSGRSSAGALPSDTKRPAATASALPPPGPSANTASPPWAVPGSSPFASARSPSKRHRATSPASRPTTSAYFDASPKAVAASAATVPQSASHVQRIIASTS